MSAPITRSRVMFTLEAVANDTEPPLASVTVMSAWVEGRRPTRAAASLHAKRIYELAKHDPSDPPGPGFLISKLFGPDVMRADYERPDAIDAQWVVRDRAWRLMIPAGLEHDTLTLALALSLACRYLAELDPYLPDFDSLVDSLAAAVILPDGAVPVALREFGRDAEAIASQIDAPHHIIVQRLNDVLGGAR